MNNSRSRRSPLFASFVKGQRKRRAWTRRDLAYRVGIDPSYVTLIEQDGYCPSIPIVEAIAAALKVDSDELLLMAGFAPTSAAGLEAALKAIRGLRPKKQTKKSS